MKKFLSLLLSILLIVSSANITVFAEYLGETVNIKAVSDKTEVKKDETFTMTVSFEQAVEKMGNMKLQLDYDEELVSFVGSTAGYTGSAAEDLEDAGNKYVLFTYDTDGDGLDVPANSVMFTVTFKVITDEAKANVAPKMFIEDGDFGDATFDMNDIPYTLSDVTVSAVVALSSADVSLPDGMDSIPVPKAGETVPSIDLVEGEGIESATYEVTPADEKYVAGKTYTETITIVPEDGYVFDENTKVNIGGIDVEYDEETGNLIGTRTNTVSKIGIDSIEVKGDVPAKPALKADCPYEDVELTADNATVEYQIFYNGEIYGLIKYSGDKTYIQTITVTPNENYKFDENTVITFADEEDFDGFERSFEDGKYVFRRTTKVDKLVIDEITVKGYTDPKTGETYERNLTFEAEGITIISYGVVIKGESLSLSEGTKYLGDTEYEYQLRFPIAESKYYKFAENVELVDENGVELTGENGFVETKKDEYEIIFKKNVKTSPKEISSVEITAKENLSYEHTDAINKEDFVVTVNYNDGTNEVLGGDEYTISPEKAKYNQSEEITVTATYGEFKDSVKVKVAKKAIKTEDVNFNNLYTYSGSEIEAKVTVTVNGEKLLPTDYDVEYIGERVNPGEGKIRIVGKGNYCGETDYFGYKIIHKGIEKTEISLSQDRFVYDGNPKTPEVVVTDTDRNVVLVKDKDYTVTYENNTNSTQNSFIGATVTVTGIGNYNNSADKNFHIDPAILTLPEVKAQDKVYDGTNDATIVAGKLSGVVAGDTVEVTESIKGKFSDEYVQNGKVVTFTISGDNKFKLSGEDAGNYVLTQPSGFFEAGIMPAEQEIEILNDGFEVVKNGKTDLSQNVSSNAKPQDKVNYTFTLAEEVPGISIDGNYVVTNNDATIGNSYEVSVKAGAIDINGDGLYEYDAAAEEKFNIEIVAKLDPDLVIKDYEDFKDDVIVNKTFGDPDFTFEATISEEAKNDNGKWSWTVKAGTDVVSITDNETAKPTFHIENAGVAFLEVVYESENYCRERKVYIKIAQKDISDDTDEDITVSGVESEYEYSGESIMPDPVVKFRNITLVKDTDYTVSLGGNLTNVTDAGVLVTITAINGSNYTGSRTLKYKIVPKTLTESMVNEMANVYYDGTEHNPAPVVKDGNKALTAGTDFTVGYSEDVINAGDVVVTVEGMGNYGGKIERTFKIVPATLTLPNAKAQDKVYDGTDVATIVAGDLAGVIGTDIVNVAVISIEGKFNDQFAGTGKTVTTENEFELTGKHAENYTLTQPGGLTATIAAKNHDLTVAISDKTAARNAETILDGCVVSDAGDVKFTYQLDSSIDYAEIVGNKVKVSADATVGTTIVIKATAEAKDVNGDGTPEYNLGYEWFNVTVTNKQDAEIDVTDTINKVYKDADFLVAAKVNAAAAAENGEWSWAFVSGDDVVSINREDIANPSFSIKKAGTAILKVVYESATYRDEAQVTIIVDQKVITEADVTFYNINDNHIFDGEEITLDYGTSLSPDDYEIVYENNVEAGTATVTVKGTGNYKGEFSKEFEIKAYELTDANVKLADPTEKFVYGGDEKKPEVVVKAGIKTLVKDTDYTVSYSNNVKAGTATVTVEGIGNYSGKVSKEFVINQKEVTVVADATDRPYKDGNVKVEVKASAIEGLIGEDASTVVLVKDTVEGTVKDPWAEDGKDVTLSEKFAITGTGAENYEVKQPVVEVNITPFIQEFVLTGKKLEVARSSKINLHDYIKSNVDEADVTFSIVNANGTGAVVNGGTELFVPAEAEVGTIFKIGAYSMSKNLGGTIVEEFSTAIGVYEFKVVEKQETTVTIRNKVTEKTFGDKNFGMEVSASPVEGNGTYTWTSSDESVIKVLDPNNSSCGFEVVGVGKATITATYEDNTYLGSDSVEIEVKAKEIAKPKADTRTYTYNGKDQTYKLAENSAYTIENATQKNAGTYEVTVSLNDKVNTKWKDAEAGKETEDLTFQFVINKAAVKMPNIGDIKVTYNGKEQKPIAENDLYDVSYDKETKNAGEYVITVSLKDPDNYKWAGNLPDGTTESGDLTGKLTIEKATVTVTAKDQSAVVGGKAPELGKDSYTIKGLVGDDSITVEIKYASTPNMSVPGSVRIIVSGPANVPNSDNYEEINYVNGTLTISKRRTEKEEVTIDLRNPSVGKTDDESNPNTGAPVVETAFNAGYAIAAVLGGLVVLGKKK